MTRRRFLSRERARQGYRIARLKNPTPHGGWVDRRRRARNPASRRRVFRPSADEIPWAGSALPSWWPGPVTARMEGVDPRGVLRVLMPLARCPAGRRARIIRPCGASWGRAADLGTAETGEPTEAAQRFPFRFAAVKGNKRLADSRAAEILRAEASVLDPSACPCGANQDVSGVELPLGRGSQARAPGSTGESAAVLPMLGA
jgi:hypothetical protein